MTIESAFIAGQAPWRGIGTEVIGNKTAKAAIRAAKLNWKVELENIQTVSGKPIEDTRAVVRTSDNSVLSLVGPIYQPIQNETSFDLMDAAVAQGKALYHTAGSLDGGRRIWILVQLPGALKLGKGKADVTERFVLLHNSHDASSKLRMFPTAIRVACKNSLNLALRAGGEDGVSIRHTAAAEQQLKEVVRVLQKAAAYYKEFDQAAHKMVSARYTDAQMKALAEFVFPARGSEDDEEAEAAGVTLSNREKLLDLFENGAGHQAIRGSAWAALNAVAEWTDHLRNTRTDERRVRSAWFGKGARIKRAAHEFLMAEIEGRRPPLPVPVTPKLVAAPVRGRSTAA